MVVDYARSPGMPARRTAHAARGMPITPQTPSECRLSRVACRRCVAWSTLATAWVQSSPPITGVLNGLMPRTKQYLGLTSSLVITCPHQWNICVDLFVSFVTAMHA